MHKLSGLILDSYDDTDGAILRSIFPTLSDVPEIIKQAHYLSYEERTGLPSTVFALEATDGDVTLRKFACTDPGNTALSVSYFLKTAGKLPREAQKVAALNLCRACSWYGLEPPPELLKASGVLGSVMAPINTYMNAKAVVGTAKEIKNRLGQAKQLGGTVIPGAIG